jgi:hypothetical protein
MRQAHWPLKQLEYLSRRRFANLGTSAVALRGYNRDLRMTEGLLIRASQVRILPGALEKPL